MDIRRPRPPEEILSGLSSKSFLPSPELGEWARATFIESGSPLENTEHAHLQQAEVEFAWTNEPNSRHGRVILAQCELMPPMAMGKWARSRATQQMSDWFGQMPDFLITISAEVGEIMDDVSFCALVEHELYHAAQDTDEFGMPKFSKKTGRPVFAIRGHDVEEFVGVVDRYGMAGEKMRELVEAANRGPSIEASTITAACGNCAKK